MAKSKLSIQPLADRVVIKAAEAEQVTKSGIIIPDTAKEKPQRGEVVAVGPGKKDEPTTVKVGDIISVIGSPEGWHDTATVGRVSNINQQLGVFAPTEAWNDIIFIDADILPGVSGGMVIGTDGKVIGSVMGIVGQQAEIGIGERAVCPSNKIIALLQQMKKENY